MAQLPPDEQLRLANKIERRERQWRTIVANERAKNEANSSSVEECPECLSSITTEISDKEAISEAIKNSENPNDAIRKILRQDSLLVE